MKMKSNHKLKQMKQMKSQMIQNGKMRNPYSHLRIKQLKEPILRKLVKAIETKSSRELTDVEISILKPFYKDLNIKWASRTKSTGAVKKQLQKL